ncbi:MAG: sugar ABC transporter ATP-binding protein [Planctomycetes bacterium]|nr:sugar ABC transporter ATP-binding protein [Planctomycetota bacterium]
MTGVPPLISIDGISKRFGGVTALEGVSFEIRAGEFHAIVGENGAGKSTLMNILAGVLTDYDGELRLRGETVRFAGTRDAERAGIAIIHQELNLVEELSTAANIFLGREKRNRLRLLDDAAMQREAAELFERLGCPIRPHTLVRELRVGDQQLVEIAKALSLEAGILIMDEPTSALTESEVDRLFGVIERLRSRGVTILYISHKLDEVFRLSDRITVLRDGRLVQTLDRTATSPREIAHLMVGREIEEVEIGRDRHAGDVVLQVEQLSLPWTGHARQWRLKDVSFHVRKGEVLGLAGLMGAGRTELLECLFGTSAAAPQGVIRLEGREVKFQHPAEALEAGVALVTEDRKRLGLFAHMNVRENITTCTLDEASRAGLISRRTERRLAVDSMALLGVRAAGPHAPVMSLSGGNQQKCIIARWLRTQPKVLLLDDPTRGVDVGAKAEIYRIVDDLCRRGLGIIVTSSELPELIALCDRMLVLCEGRVTAELARAEFTEQRIMEAATRRESNVEPRFAGSTV